MKKRKWLCREGQILGWAEYFFGDVLTRKSNVFSTEG